MPNYNSTRSSCIQKFFLYFKIQKILSLEIQNIKVQGLLCKIIKIIFVNSIIQIFFSLLMDFFPVQDQHPERTLQVGWPPPSSCRPECLISWQTTLRPLSCHSWESCPFPPELELSWVGLITVKAASNKVIMICIHSKRFMAIFEPH